MADLNFGSHFENSEEDIKSYSKLKDGLKLPSSMKRHVSLSDIIAATIGDEARSGDMMFSENLDYNIDNCQLSSNLKTENSNNACDVFDSRFNAQENVFQQNDTLREISFSTNQINGLDTRSTDIEFTTNIGFDTNMDFFSSLFGPDESKPELQESSTCPPIDTSQNVDISSTEKEKSQKANTSYDSDLEDSMHFVEPDVEESSFQNDADDNFKYLEPTAKKQRVSLNDSSSCPFPITSIDYSEGNQDFLSLFNDEQQGSFHKMNGIARARSFSGNIKPKLSRQSGKLNLHNRNMHKTPNFGRTRSFSEACNRQSLSPLSDSSFNTSLSSLLESPENSPLSTNPFFSDLKSLLISDCNSTDCPKTLFETLSNKPSQDVYARERNLQSKFSSLQGKYPDEVRELSSFYRQQSAEVETERLKEIHDDNVPKSYRNHLNSYYDNQLHMIMERVERSLSLLLRARREIVTINRPFKSRPLLSRKAVKMMEEWYSRNFEHPYPGPTAVEALAKAGEITNEQVKKWFANKRNRNKNTKPVPEIANIKRKRQFSARW